jgi:hypothetical protein
MFVTISGWLVFFMQVRGMSLHGPAVALQEQPRCGTHAQSAKCRYGPLRVQAPNNLLSSSTSMLRVVALDASALAGEGTRCWVYLWSALQPPLP